MATVMVTIDGKTYRMACEEGQEDYLIELARRFSLYIRHLKTSFGEIGDHRLSVMAGIMVLDEMGGLEKKLRELEQENQALQEAQNKLTTQTREREQSLARTIEDMAKRIERLGQRLEMKAGASS